MSTAQVDIEQMRALLEHARAIGTVDKWCELALDWMQTANDRLVQYREHDNAKTITAG